MHIRSIILFFIGTMLLFATAAAAQDSNGHEEHDMMGQLIRETTDNDYKLSYRLIDMREQMKGMADMPEMSATHHLMLYITGPDGKAVHGATVGFLVEGPNRADQKVMAMSMGDGYGADIYLGDPGTYTIRSKAVFNGEKLIDGFEHKMP